MSEQLDTVGKGLVCLRFHPERQLCQGPRVLVGKKGQASLQPRAQAEAAEGLGPGSDKGM